jgi:hypothetical protein
MPSTYDENTKARAVRLVCEHRGDYNTEWAAMRAISARLGMSAETLVDDGPNLGQGRRSKSRPRGRGYCAVLSALAEGRVSIPVSLSR